jgi:hypothetical protein
MAYVCGKGVTIENNGTASYVAVAQVTSITPPSMEVGTIEVTHLTSTMREHKASIAEPGEASFTIEWDPENATHAQLWTDFQAGNTLGWKIIFVNAGSSEITFNGFITSFPIQELTVDSVAIATINIKIDGSVTITP